MQQNCPPVPFSSTVPDMTESSTFHPLLKAVKAGVPIGCYLALAMTTVGHRYSVGAEILQSVILESPLSHPKV